MWPQLFSPMVSDLQICTRAQENHIKIYTSADPRRLACFNHPSPKNSIFQEREKFIFYHFMTSCVEKSYGSLKPDLGQFCFHLVRLVRLSSGADQFFHDLKLTKCRPITFLFFTYLKID